MIHDCVWDYLRKVAAIALLAGDCDPLAIRCGRQQTDKNHIHNAYVSPAVQTHKTRDTQNLQQQSILCAFLCAIVVGRHVWPTPIVITAAKLHASALVSAYLSVHSRRTPAPPPRHRTAQYSTGNTPTLTQSALAMFNKHIGPSERSRGSEQRKSEIFLGVSRERALTPRAEGGRKTCDKRCYLSLLCNGSLRHGADRFSLHFLLKCTKKGAVSAFSH